MWPGALVVRARRREESSTPRKQHRVSFAQKPPNLGKSKTAQHIKPQRFARMGKEEHEPIFDAFLKPREEACRQGENSSKFRFAHAENECSKGSTGPEPPAAAICYLANCQFCQFDRPLYFPSLDSIRIVGKVHQPAFDSQSDKRMGLRELFTSQARCVDCRSRALG